MTGAGAIATRTGAWLCLACGKCTPSCPLAVAGADFAPRRLVAAALDGRAGDGRGLLSACLTCGACEVRCPEGVQISDFVRGARALLPPDARPVPPHHRVLGEIALRAAAGGGGPRPQAWLTPDLKVQEKGKVALFVGCLPFFDVLYADLGVRTVEIARAAVRLLNRLGIEPALLADECCCGHDLLWSGDRESFEALARRNARAIAAAGAETVLTACAECARTLALDVPAAAPGFRAKVQHLAEFLAPRRAELGLAARRTDAGAEAVAYHDPCRLGRHRGVYDAPRELIRGVPGVELREMAASGRDARCCGTSGFIRCDATSRRIQADRLDEARRTGAARLLTACPKCLIHFACAEAEDRRRAAVAGAAPCPGCALCPPARSSRRQAPLHVQDLIEFIAGGEP